MRVREWGTSRDGSLFAEQTDLQLTRHIICATENVICDRKMLFLRKSGKSGILESEKYGVRESLVGLETTEPGKLDSGYSVCEDDITCLTCND